MLSIIIDPAAMGGKAFETSRDLHHLGEVGQAAAGRGQVLAPGEAGGRAASTEKNGVPIDARRGSSDRHRARVRLNDRIPIPQGLAGDRLAKMKLYSPGSRTPTSQDHGARDQARQRSR